MTELKDFKVSADGALEKYLGRGDRVIVPEGVRSILSDAFDGADVAFLILPKSFTCEDISYIYSIETLEEINVDPENPVFSSLDGVLYNKEKTELLRCPPKKTGELIIPHSVTAVGYAAFAFCDKLTAVSFGTDVELCLGDNAFFGCEALDELRITQNTYGNFEYMLAGFNRAVSVIVDDGYLCPEFSIGYAIFLYVKNIYFNMSFEEAISTEFLKLYLEETDGDAALYFTDANGGYTRFTPPVDENGEYKLPTGFVIIDGELVEYNGRNCEVNIPNDGSVTSLGSNAFDCWYMLSEEEILKSVSIPSSVKRIAHDAFYNTFISDSITVDADNPLYRSADNCLIDKKDGTLVKACLNGAIPDDGTVSSIGFGAFWGNLSLNTLSVPTSVTHIANEAFCFCPSLEKAVIPASVRSIGIEAFFGCDKLKEVIIEADDIMIGSNAFEGCKDITLCAKEGSSALEYAAKKGLKSKIIK